MIENFITISNYAGRYLHGIGITLYMTIMELSRIHQMMERMENSLGLLLLYLKTG